jgi:hypothetical protein
MRLREEEEKERGIVNITRLLAAALHSTAASSSFAGAHCLIRPSSLAALPVQSYLEPALTAMILSLLLLLLC